MRKCCCCSRKIDTTKTNDEEDMFDEAPMKARKKNTSKRKVREGANLGLKTIGFEGRGRHRDGTGIPADSQSRD